jgi:hypothetical protein
MKGSRRSARKTRLTKHLYIRSLPSSGDRTKTSPTSSREPKPPSPDDAQNLTRQIADKLQILALRRPNALKLIDVMLAGLLSDQRHEDAS